jgi:hypothetical protein
VSHLLFRARGTAIPADAGKDFLVDNVSPASSTPLVGAPTSKDQCKNGGWMASAGKGPSSLNNGGGTPSCGNSCDFSANPTDFHKPCDPVPGNGCHKLPDTPCERGHGNTESKNKHCAGRRLGTIFLGYADTYRPPGTGEPSIWEGSPGVILVGCGVNPKRGQTGAS